MCVYNFNVCCHDETRRRIVVQHHLCFANYKKGCTRLAAASDKVYQLRAHGRWFYLGTPASSTTTTGRHNIAENGVKTPNIKS